MADAVSSDSCPIFFKVLMLNIAICIIRLHFSHFCLTTVADFSNLSRMCPFLPVRRVMQLGNVV